MLAPLLEVFVGYALVVVGEEGCRLERGSLARGEDGIVDVPRRLDLVVNVEFLCNCRADGASIAALSNSGHANPNDLLEAVIDDV